MSMASWSDWCREEMCGGNQVERPAGDHVDGDLQWPKSRLDKQQTDQCLPVSTGVRLRGVQWSATESVSLPVSSRLSNCVVQPVSSVIRVKGKQV